MVSTLDFESSDPSSNLGRTLVNTIFSSDIMVQKWMLLSTLKPKETILVKVHNNFNMSSWSVCNKLQIAVVAEWLRRWT